MAPALTSLFVARLTHPISVSTATTTATISTGIHTFADTPFPLLPTPLLSDARRRTSLVGLADTDWGYRTTERASQRSVRGQNGVDENILLRPRRLFIVVS